MRNSRISMIAALLISPYDLFVDAEDNITALDTRHTLKVDSEGNELSRSEMPSSVPMTFWRNLPIVMSPTRDAFYIWSQFEDRYHAFGKYSLDRTLLYYRLTEPNRFVVIDPQTRWSGAMTFYAPTSKRTIAIGKKSAYLVGGYANQYSDAAGRMVGTSTIAMSVGRYDLDGNRIWFQELLLEGDPVARRLWGARARPSSSS